VEVAHLVAEGFDPVLRAEDESDWDDPGNGYPVPVQRKMEWVDVSAPQGADGGNRGKSAGYIREASLRCGDAYLDFHCYAQLLRGC
jgi:hypothetical protein